jgi:hypothetical protein
MASPEAERAGTIFVECVQDIIDRRICDQLTPAFDESILDDYIKHNTS